MAKSKGRLLSELAEAPKNEDYSDVNALPNTGNKVGDQAFVEETDRLYIWNGSGWYNIALINTTPTWDSGGQPASSYELSADSPQTATSITLAASDPEGLPISYTYVTGGSMDSIATISQDSSVFTITPKTLSQVPDGGTGSITFRASDGINILPQVSSFTLNFVTIIENSKHTTLLVTAVDTSDNNNITDASTNNHSITVNGDARAGTFSPHRSGGYATLIPNGDANNLVIADDTSFDIYDGDFTVEAWLYPTSFNTSQNHWVSKGGNTTREWSFTLNSTEITAYWTTGGTSSTDSTVTVSSTNSINEWMHICVKKSGSTLTIYKNGASLGTGTFTSIYNGSGTIKVGRLMDFTGISHSFNGYISDLRIVKGTAITPPSGGPTERLEAVTNTSLLTCHLPYIADGSTNDHSITVNGDVSTKPFSPYDYEEYDAADHGGSIYFDVNGDWITATGIDLSSARTIEFWYYKSTNSTAIETIFSIGNGYTDNVGVSLFTRNGDFEFRVGSSIVYDSGASLDLFDFTWHHIAIVISSSNSADLYINGSRKYSGSNVTRSNSMPISIGSSVSGLTWNGSHEMQGFISDFAIFNSAKYSGTSITVPTAALSSTGSELHIKGTDASIIDKSQGTNLKLVGTTTGSTTQVKFAGTKSIYSDGTAGNHISIPSDDSIFSKDYTIEFWMYPTQDTNLLMPFSKGVGLQFYHQSGNVGCAMSSSNSGTYFYNGNFGSITTNAWSHISLVRNSSASTYKFYMNGILGDTLSSSTNINAGSADWIIAAYSTAGHYAFEGYIQDVRVTEGLTRYTANFTPPTASLEG